MAATEGMIKKADLAKAREIDYVWKFVDDIRGLMLLLGTTRPIKVKSGTVLTAYKTTGELIDGSQVEEGATIPLSNLIANLAAAFARVFCKPIPPALVVPLPGVSEETRLVLIALCASESAFLFVSITA